MEVRVGFSLPNVTNPADLSALCDQIDYVYDISTNLVTDRSSYPFVQRAIVTCKDPDLLGRYITIQKIGVGQLGFSAVDYMSGSAPAPGKLTRDHMF